MLGFAPGFVSLNYYFPEKRISITVLQNIARADIGEAFFFHTGILELLTKVVSGKNENYFEGNEN